METRSTASFRSSKGIQKIHHCCLALWDHSTLTKQYGTAPWFHSRNMIYTYIYIIWFCSPYDCLNLKSSCLSQSASGWLKDKGHKCPSCNHPLQLTGGVAAATEVLSRNQARNGAASWVNFEKRLHYDLTIDDLVGGFNHYWVKNHG